MPPAVTRVAQLEYDGIRERLIGVIGQAPPFNLIAYATGTGAQTGPYECRYLAHHRHLFECIQLSRMGEPGAQRFPFPVPGQPKVSDVFIHGSGPSISGGGILITDNAERLRLNKAVKEFAGLVILLVTHASARSAADVDNQLV